MLVREAQPPKKVSHVGATHIVKAFDQREFPELAANEMICMSGAAAAGIQTAHARLSSNRRFLIVDRFDIGIPTRTLRRAPDWRNAGGSDAPHLIDIRLICSLQSLQPERDGARAPTIQQAALKLTRSACT